MEDTKPTADQAIAALRKHITEQVGAGRVEEVLNADADAIEQAVKRRGVVRAKFQCTRVEQGAGYEGHNNSIVTLTAVSGEQNKTWSKWTPFGNLQMTINNPEAIKSFEIGKYYFLDFTEAPAKESDEKK